MLVLATFCGLRAREIAGLDREDVRETLATPVLVILGKGGKDRIVPHSVCVVMKLQAFGMPTQMPTRRRVASRLR